jgi:hypothetical protein
MDFEVMKKKLDAYRKPSGQIRRVKGELLIELLRMWEAHTGPSTEFARNLGIKSKQLSRLVHEARKAAATTEAADASFYELPSPEATETPRSEGIEVTWGPGKVIRFPTVETLLDFLKRAS